MVEAIRQGDIPGVQLRYRQRLELSVDAAWRWLTEPALLERWAAQRAEVDLGDSGSLLLERSGTDGPRLERGDTLEIVPPRRWSLAFRRLDDNWRAATRLTWQLAPIGDGCELDVFQEGFEHLSLSTGLTVWEEYRRRWRAAAERLVSASR
jgi:uncharacterized protein YndB with AHSA1/START domain